MLAIQTPESNEYLQLQNWSSGDQDYSTAHKWNCPQKPKNYCLLFNRSI